MDPEHFQYLFQQVRQGNSQAATELVQAFEPTILRRIRLELTDPKLRQVLDSVDICQSIMAGFFLRVALGEIDLSHPGELCRLLHKMAQHKVITVARRHQADCRDVRRESLLCSGEWARILDRDGDPSKISESNDLLQAVQQHLSPEESELLQKRIDGWGWVELSKQSGQCADAIRKRLGRALLRVLRHLELEEQDG